MADVMYEYTKGDVSVVLLQNEIRAEEAITKLCNKILFMTPNRVCIYFVEALSSEELLALNTVVGNHSSLSDQKNQRRNQVDIRTAELISAGFEYDSQLFSLSLEAQKNWLAFKTMQSFFTWPVNISTKDGGEYSLSESDINTFVGLGLSEVKNHMDSGRMLKLSINAATTQEELDAIEDSR